MYTNEQTQQDREATRHLLSYLSSRAKNMWLAVCVWKSPIDSSLEHREGYFLTYNEAEQFYNMLDTTYEKWPALNPQLFLFYTDEKICQQVNEKLVK